MAPAEPPTPTRPLDRASPLPLWAQVRDDLVLRVQAHEFSGRDASDAGGTREFPGEMALRDEYGVSRQTIRQALSGLRTDGVLMGSRGRPPKVADPALIQQPLGVLYSLHASVEAAGLDQRSEVLRLEVVTGSRLPAHPLLPPRPTERPMTGTTATATTPAEIDPAATAERVRTGHALLLDVREDDEWAAGHAPGAVHRPLGSLDPAALPAGRPVIAVCRSGARSSRAVAALTAAGVGATDLTGGMQAWRAAGLPVVRDDGSPGTVI